MVDAGPEPTYSEINEGTPLGGGGSILFVFSQNCLHESTFCE